MTPKSKRSVALALIMAPCLIVGGCSGDNSSTNGNTNVTRHDLKEGQGIIFKNTEECASSIMFSQEECAELYKQAQAGRPAFSAKEECEKQYGTDACSNTPQVFGSGTSLWVPAIAGFMAGRAMDGAFSTGLYRNQRDKDDDSYYNGRGNYVSGGSGGGSSARTGRVMIVPQAALDDARPAKISRFGGGKSIGTTYSGRGEAVGSGSKTSGTGGTTAVSRGGFSGSNSFFGSFGS